MAVVTGGGSGVGRAICEHLGAAGARVAILDLDGDAAAETADALGADGITTLASTVDVGDRDAVASAFDRVRVDLGPIEILVTSAAVSGFVPFDELSVAAWERTMRVNLSGTFHCIQLAIPDMVAGGWGRVVTISSVAGQTGSLRQGHYSASKGGVIALTKTVALEYAANGITANSVAPFIVDTPMLRKAQAEGHVPEEKILARMTPVGRLGRGDDIASACAFLCSDGAGYVTGQVIAVNGGAVT